MSEQEGTFGDVDRLVESAIRGVSALARRGSLVTTVIALVAVLVVGLAYLAGIAAFDGGTQTVWLVVGGLFLLAAAGAPLLASVRLRRIPRDATRAAAELRTLLGRHDEAKRVVIDTVAHEGSEGGRVTALIAQGQSYTRLRTIVGRSDDLAALAATFRRLATLPGLVAVGLILIAAGALLGFVFTLVWIF